MSEFAIVFVQLAGVVAGLALMGVVIWAAQEDEFHPTRRFAPLRTARPVGRRAPATTGRTSPRPVRSLHPAYSRRR
jgi:hypothetical protein